MSAGSQALMYNSNCPPLLERPRSRVSYHGEYSTNTFVDESSLSTPTTARLCPAMGPSCQALRNAVAALNRLDDFNCEKIGAGFFSEVFKVTHRTSGQVMVLKMNMSHSNRPNMLREVQLMNRLSHPNILRFMGVCVHEGQLHALTEYINGGSLEQLLLNKSVALSWKVRIELAQDIAKGIRYLHSRGVFHRDLTSKNVLIKNEDNSHMLAVVGDFGLAEKIPDPLAKFRLPTVGSPYWMAPECLKGKFYNEKADVFSYGIILCEIIARVEADPDFLPRTENFGLDYIAFSDMCPDCPPEFLKLAFTCCMIDPKQRPAFTELVDQLDIILDDMDAKLSGEELGMEGLTGSSSKNVAATTYKMLHRRSKSEDTLLTPSNGFTTPSDKARCHYHHGRQRSNGDEANDEEDDDDEGELNAGLRLMLTPKHVGEAMSLGDPYYRPGSRNPFAALAQLNGGCRKILASSRDLFSSCFELPSPAAASTPPSSPMISALDRLGVSHCQLSRSNSLPDSPTLLRQTLVRQSGRDGRNGGRDTVALPSSSTCSVTSSSSRSPSRSSSTSTTHPRSLSEPDDGSSSFYVNGESCLVFDGSKLGRRRGSCESGFFSVGDGEHLSPETTLEDAAGVGVGNLSSNLNCSRSSPRSSAISSDVDFDCAVVVDISRCQEDDNAILRLSRRKVEDKDVPTSRKDAVDVEDANQRRWICSNR